MVGRVKVALSPYFLLPTKPGSLRRHWQARQECKVHRPINIECTKNYPLYTVRHTHTAFACDRPPILRVLVFRPSCQIDKFLYSSEDYIKAGAVLAVGIVSR